MTNTPKYLVIVEGYAVLGTWVPQLYKQPNKTQENNTKTAPGWAAGGRGAVFVLFSVCIFVFV